MPQDTVSSSQIKQEIVVKTEDCLENVTITIEAEQCIKTETDPPKIETVFVKIEAIDEETKPVSLETETSQVKVKQEVCVKEEPSWTETEWDEIEESPQAALYAGHDVKPDLVIGMESLQPGDAAFTKVSLRANHNLREKGRLKKGSVPNKDARKDPKPSTLQEDIYIVNEGYRETIPIIYCDETKFKCHLCDKICYTKQQLLSHMNRHMYNNPYFCSFSYKHFSTQAYSDTPRIEHTGDIYHRCDICGKRFIFADALRKHRRIHTEKKRHTCDVCNKKFREKSQMLMHALIHQGEAGKKYTCQYCQKKFIHRYKLAIHERSHTGDKPFECAVCKRGYAQKYSLQVHLRQHGEEAGRRCKKCGLTFPNEYELERHEQNYPGLSCLKYSCEVCKKMFKEKRDLERHERSHTGVRPYACDECGKAFTQKGHLTGHKKIHTGQKPFACTFCDLRCATKGTLNKHIQRSHANGETRSLVCEICNKEFIRPCHFALHAKTHKRTTPKNLNT